MYETCFANCGRVSCNTVSTIYQYYKYSKVYQTPTGCRQGSIYIILLRAARNGIQQCKHQNKYLINRYCDLSSIGYCNIYIYLQLSCGWETLIGAPEFLIFWEHGYHQLRLTTGIPGGQPWDFSGHNSDLTLKFMMQTNLGILSNIRNQMILEFRQHQDLTIKRLDSANHYGADSQSNCDYDLLENALAEANGFETMVFTPKFAGFL